jgi:hypothetical protein
MKALGEESVENFSTTLPKVEPLPNVHMIAASTPPSQSMKSLQAGHRGFQTTYSTAALCCWEVTEHFHTSDDRKQETITSFRANTICEGRRQLLVSRTEVVRRLLRRQTKRLRFPSLPCWFGGWSAKSEKSLWGACQTAEDLRKVAGYLPEHSFPSYAHRHSPPGLLLLALLLRTIFSETGLQRPVSLLRAQDCGVLLRSAGHGGRLREEPAIPLPVPLENDKRSTLLKRSGSLIRLQLMQREPCIFGKAGAASANL